jgi:cytochrome c oxidase subunit 1
MADAAIHGHDHGEKGFFVRWFMSTNHKDIGILYLFTGGLVGLISVIFTVYMRMELMNPGVQYMCAEGMRLSAAAAGEVCTPNGHLWNVTVTAHGILMMFFVVIPALFGGFGNYFMPLQIGAPDMAFPRMNNLSYWLYVAGTSLAVASVFSPGGNGQLGSGVGWVLYPPLSTRESGFSMDLALFAVHLSGASSILGAINMITTFLNMRAPGMTMHKVPLFGWSIFVTAWLILLSLPVLAGAITMLITDRNFGRPPSSTPRAAATRSCTSTSCGSSATRKCTSSSSPPSASSATSSRPSRRSRCSAICRWSTRWSASVCWASSSGRTTCTPWACR